MFCGDESQQIETLILTWQNLINGQLVHEFYRDIIFDVVFAVGFSSKSQMNCIKQRLLQWSFELNADV